MRSPAPQVFHVSGRLVIQVLEGDSVAQTVENLRAQHEASRVEWVGTGRVDSVRWLGADAPARGPLEVIQLTGSATADQQRLVLLGRAEDGQLRSGALADARAVELELSLELLVAETATAVEAAGAGPAPATWAAVAAASAKVEEAERVEEAPAVPLPQVGDHIEHSAFGDCVVEKVEEDEDFVMVRSPTQRLLRLSLDVLRLELISEAEGRRRYRARPPAGKGRP